MSFQIFTSDKKTINQNIELGISPDYSHCFAGIRFFNSSGDQVTPTAGTVHIQARHVTNNQYDDPVNAVIDASSKGAEAEWGGNVNSIKAIPSNVAGSAVDTYQVVVVQNLS